MAEPSAHTREVRLQRRWLRGYDPEEVNSLLAEISSAFEEKARECEAHCSEIEALQRERSEHREIESRLRRALLSAEAEQDRLEQASAENQRASARARVGRREPLGGKLRETYRSFLMRELRRLERDTRPGDTPYRHGASAESSFG